MKSEEKKGMRQLMPATAELVDELRVWLGRERVDVAIQAGMRVKREYERRVLDHGKPLADAWLRRQPCPLGLFWASEGGHEIGVQRP